ncbi:MAG: DNA polymerase III subunit alpha, partial [Alphaproteobacteria bacterium]
MAHADFVHLRVHTTYSLSEGALKIDELIGLAVADAMPAVAITDTANLFGALEFAGACAKAGVQPIIGCQIGVRREDGTQPGGGGMAPAPDTLVLLVQNEAGYRNLLRLVSRSFLESDPGEPPQVSLADLEAANEGLIALSGGVAGAVGRLLVEGQDKAAGEALSRLASIFPGRFYIEIMRHGMADERAIEAALIALADANDLPLLATNEAFFTEESMFEAHDALLCIAGGNFVDEDERRRLTPEHSFKPAADMRVLFADLPESVDNTLVVARRCAFFPEEREPILPAFSSAAGKTEVEQLRAQAKDGLNARLERLPENSDPEPYRERLAHELGIIEDMNYPGYFLIVAEFIDWAKQAGIPVGPGRGSGVGSVVAWALGITDLEPLRWGLLFERFLNPERVSMPDFDIDFCQDRRDEVIHYVQQKYGLNRVAQIITFGKLQARAVLRDVGRVLRMPYGQVDRICKLVPNNPASPVNLQQAIDGEPLLQDMRRDDPTVGRLMNIALKLEGLYRHASTHAAGVVIGDRPLDELVPLYRDPRSPMRVTQFNMKDVERAGLVKFDFLGLKTLTVLARAVELLAARGIDIDLGNLPLDDPATFEMLGRGESTGVFQLEGAGMRDVLRQLRPDRFEDIIAVVALYRPGPMENIPNYIARK